MKAVQLPKVGYRPSEFAGREPLQELVNREPDLSYVFSCISRKRGADLQSRFETAKDRLRTEFGAHICIVQGLGGLSVAAKYEFLTTDRTIDEHLDHLVMTAGFSLVLRSRPMLELPYDERFEKTGRFVEYPLPLAPGKNGMGGIWCRKDPVYELRMERVYVITERQYASAELHRAAESAEALYSILRTKLKLPPLHQDLPDNVIPISSRSAPRAEMKSGVFDKDGTQVS